MTDPSKDLDIDAFFGFDTLTGVQEHDDGPPPSHVEAEDAVLAQALVTPVGVAEAAPAASGPQRGSTGRTEDVSGLDQLTALVFTSQHGGPPHIVIIHRSDAGVSHVTCPCKAGTFNRRGCWAMLATRNILGVDHPSRSEQP